MFSYNPLWKQLIDKNMTKEDLRSKIVSSPNTIAKMGKGEYVAMDVLDRICNVLSCKLSDVVEHIPDLYDAEDVNSIPRDSERVKEFMRTGKIKDNPYWFDDEE